MTGIRKWKVCCAALAFLAGSAAAARAADLSGQAKQEAINSINKLLAENYVYPETAEKMARHLEDRRRQGAYEEFSDGEKFAEQLTADLQEISKDRHLRVRFDPEAAARMAERGDDGPSPEDRARFVEESRRRNFSFRELKILDGNVGYLKLDGFSGLGEAGETAAAAMNFLANADALIIDLRTNGGGSPTMIQILSSYLFEPEPKHLNSFYWRPRDETTQTWTLPYVPGRRNAQAEVFVLTSKRTFSAAEEFTYNLKNMKRATIVGETTGGGAHPGGTMPANGQFVVWVPKGRAINPITGKNWEGVGVQPDISVPADQALDRAHLEALDRLIAKTEEQRPRGRYEWARETLAARLEPVILPQPLLESYAGQYGPRSLRLEEGRLLYQREDGPVYAMIPMSEELFMFVELPYFRLRIIRESGQPVAVEGVYDNGQRDRHERDR